MKQRFGGSRHRDLLRGIAADPTAVVRAVSRDVGEPADRIAPAVEAYVNLLAADDPSSPVALASLRAVGAEAARAGIALQVVLDRYLSTGWAVWAAVVGQGEEAVDAADLAALGEVLLRAGDAFAAAIADGHAAAERDAVARDASALRAFVDDVLELSPGDVAGTSRLARRAPHFGLEPHAPHVVVVAYAGRDVEEEGPETARLSAGLAGPAGRGRRRPLVAARRGRLVVVAPQGGGDPARLAVALDEVADGASWIAVRGPVATRLADVAAAYGAASAALAVAERSGAGAAGRSLGSRGLARVPDRGPGRDARAGRRRDAAGRPAVHTGAVVDAADLALERALLADEASLRVAVDRELAPIREAPRIGDALLGTLASYLDAGQNVRAASRASGIASRTIAYRLTRIEALLGAPLDGPRARRLAVALFARDLLG